MVVSPCVFQASVLSDSLNQSRTSSRTNSSRFFPLHFATGRHLDCLRHPGFGRLQVHKTEHTKQPLIRAAYGFTPPPGSALPGLKQSQARSSSNPVLLYRSGWEKVILHGSVNGGPWQNHAMVKGNKDVWTVEVDVDGVVSPSAPLLEFVLTNGAGDWDKAPEGGNYVIEQSGVHALHNGRLTLTTGIRLMLVTDLDDTLINEDDATVAFREFWEYAANLAGSTLVFNTGRDIDKVKGLLEEKQSCMPIPDIVICSVGTQIYIRNDAGEYVEDTDWSGALSESWDLAVVRDTMMNQMAKNYGSNHELFRFNSREEQNEHKVTSTVHVDILDEVRRTTEKKLTETGVKYKFICSGKDNYRFVDVVPYRAGKLAALEHVRTKLNYCHADVVACGDSGNDEDMLGGENKAIVVGNAHTDLRKWAEEELARLVEKNGTRPRLYIATKTRAWGILEGLEDFGFKLKG